MKLFKVKSCVLALMGLFLLQTGCSYNPATGERQFTALMSTAQEISIGKEEHENIVKTYGVLDSTHPLHKYVEGIGKTLAKYAERQDITYRFYVLDTPMVNAFALPGGYIYVSRGLMAQANSEAELASVIGHEIGHVTARHIAERYSHAVVTQLGTSVLASAVDQTGASQALGLGSNLYLSSYSRKQESQSDEIGIRYITKAGYHPQAMAMFLYNLQEYTAFSNFLEGRRGESTSYFATHPQTKERVKESQAIASKYKVVPGIKINHEGYLKTIDGMVYGDSVAAGLVRNERFYHEGMDFTFLAPNSFLLKNQPTQVVMTHKKEGAIVIFDSVENNRGLEPFTYMTQTWLGSETLDTPETIMIGDKRAATASFKGTVKGQPMTIRVVAIKWDDRRIFRFQLAIPEGLSAQTMDELKRITYSLRNLTAEERNSLEPHRIQVVKAKPGDTVYSLSVNMPYDSYLPERFRVLNTMSETDAVIAGQLYKVVTDDYKPGGF